MHQIKEGDKVPCMQRDLLTYKVQKGNEISESQL